MRRCQTSGFAGRRRYPPRISSSSSRVGQRPGIERKGIAQYPCRRCERGCSFRRVSTRTIDRRHRQHTITRRKRIRQWAKEIVECTGLVSSQREQRLKNISLQMFISDKILYDRRQRRCLLTVIDLLQSNLGILGQTLLRFTAQHEGLWLLWWCHRRMML